MQLIDSADSKRQWTPERTSNGRTDAHFKQAGVGTNGILESKILPKNAHRTLEHEASA